MMIKSKLPSMKFLVAALINGLDATGQPKQKQNPDWLEKLSTGLALAFFALIALIAFLHHLGKSMDQLILYLLLPITLITSALYLFIFFREGFRYFRRIIEDNEKMPWTETWH